MNITWLNQGGFLFEISAERLVVDAYLSDIVEQREGLTRLLDPPFSLEELRPIYWLCTHDHMDHFDTPTIEKAIEKFPQCKFIGPKSVQKHLKKINENDSVIIPLSFEQQITLGDFYITALPAVHSDPDAIGVLIQAGDLRIYLSGDTEFYENPGDVAEIVGDIDLMLICINGKWGNMNSDQAVEMAKLIRPRMAVPMHYGLFAENTVSPEGFCAACMAERINTATFESGRKYDIKELLK